MATYSSHRLIMGKEEIDNFFCLIGDIYAPNFEKVDGAYCFWSVGAWVTLFVPTVTFKPLKLES